VLLKGGVTSGPERFKQYERSRDPLFAVLSRDAAKFGVSTSAVETAYDHIKESARQVALANADRSLSRIYEARNRELKQHLGTTLYARVEPALRAPTVSFSVDQAQISQSLRR
jgi:hypothetical protein